MQLQVQNTERFIRLCQSLPTSILLGKHVTLIARRQDPPSLLAVYRGPDASIQVSIPAEVDGAGEATVPIGALARFASVLRPDSPTVLRCQRRQLQLESGSIRIGFPVCDLSPFEPAVPSDRTDCAVPAQVLAELIRPNVEVVLREPNAPASRRTCFLQSDGQWIRCSATDTHRIVTAVAQGEFSSLPLLALDRVHLLLLLAGIKATRCTEPIRISRYSETNWIFGLTDGSELGLEWRLWFPAEPDESLARFFQSMRRYFDQKADQRVSLSSPSLRDALRRALQLLPSTETGFLWLLTADGRLQVATASESGACYLELLELDRYQRDLDLVVNPRYVRQAVTGEQCLIGLSQEGGLWIQATQSEPKISVSSIIMPYTESVAEKVRTAVQIAVQTNPEPLEVA